ncbi:MAG: OpgC domain-containing protein [Thermomicrobiales bacterium]
MATTLRHPHENIGFRAPLAALAARAASWRYAATSKRDLRIDLLRGFAVFAIVADHVGGDASWLYRLTGGDTFYTSAAEGFVFIAGLVFGIVYPAIVARHGLAEAMMKAFKRAGTLYLFTVALTFITVPLSQRLGVWWGAPVSRSEIHDFVLGVLTLHQTSFLTDVTLLYVLLLVGAAISLVFFSTGRTWVVLAASWGLWALWQLDYRYAGFVWGIQGNEIFHVAAWQVLFFTGLAIGYHRQALARRFSALTGPGALLASSVAFAWLIRLYHQNLAGFPGSNQARVQEWFTYKPNVGPGRLLAFAIVAIFAFSLVTNLWKPLSRAVGWLLLPLGQHALLAYGTHLFAVMAMAKFSADLTGSVAGAGQRAAVQLLAVVAVWLVIQVVLRAQPLLRTLPQWLPTSRPQPQPVAMRAGLRRVR